MADLGHSTEPKKTSNGKARPINILYQRAKRYRAQYKDEIWKQAAEYIWGDQNIRRTSDFDQNDFVSNIVYKQHNLMLSMLCRDIPSVSIFPLNESFHAAKEFIQQDINHILVANDAQIRQTEAMSYGLPFGTAFFKTTWDQSMRMGLGGIRIEIPDTRNIFFMPGMARVRNSLLMFERRLLDKLQVLHQYPEEKHYAAICAAFRIDNEVPGQETASGDAAYVDTESFGSVPIYMSGSAHMANDRPQIEVVEAWMIDGRTVEQIPELLDKLESNKRYQKMDADDKARMRKKPLYPRGRLQVFIGDHLLDDRKNPFPSFPYCQYVSQNIPVVKAGDEYPMGEFDQLLEIQDMFNTRQNQIMDAMDHTAFGGFGVTDGDFDFDEFESKPKKVYKTSRYNRFDWMNPPAVPPEAFRSVQDIYNLSREITNMHEILSGETGDVRSGDAIEQLSNLANRVMITRTHSLEACWRSVVRYCIAMQGAFYQPGVHYPEQLDLQGIGPDAFEIYIKAGLNLPTSKEAAMTRLFQLADHGSLDALDLLENTDSSILPNKEQALARLRERMSSQQAMAQQQAQAEVGNQNAQADAARAKVIPMNQGAM